MSLGPTCIPPIAGALPLFLRWHTQIDYVCRKLNNKIALLKNIIYYLTDDMKLMYYNAYILPIFDYACTVWGQQNNSYVNKLAKIQKRIARIILNRPKRSSSEELFNDLQWLTFNDRVYYHTALLVYKTNNDLTPVYMKDILRFSDNISHDLRSNSKNQLTLHIKPRKNHFKLSFTYNSYKIWNSIPFHIKNSKSILSFKDRYKKYLLD